MSIIRSMNYFGQVILEILENNQLKSYFGNSEISILSPFFEISKRRKLTLQTHVLNFKMNISREPLTLEQQMSSFDKNSFIN